MFEFAGIFGLPFSMPDVTTPLGFAVWAVVVIIGLPLLIALLHLLYFIVYGLTFAYLWIKGMIENRQREEKK